MSRPTHPRVAAFADLLAEAGADGRVHELPSGAHTAAEAAAALGCEVGSIANSLVFVADGQPLLVLTSGAHRIDLEHLAPQLGLGTTLRRASAAEVRAATGQAIGGVAPLGHPAPVRTVIDRTLADHPVVWAAGGTPHTVFPTTFDELARACGAVPVTVVADGAG